MDGEEFYEQHEVLDREHSLPAIRDWTKNHVKEEINKLDSSIEASEDCVLTGVTITDGKLSDKKELDLNTSVEASDDCVIKGITVKNGHIVSFNETNLNSSVQAKEGTVLSGITIKNGKIVDHTEFNITYLYRYKGQVENEEQLPNQNLTNGDVYSIKNRSSYGMPNQNVAWAGNHWDPLGPSFTIDTLTIKIGEDEEYNYSGEGMIIRLGDLSKINKTGNLDDILRGDGSWGSFSTAVTNTKVNSARETDKLTIARNLTLTGSANSNPVLFDGTKDINLEVYALKAESLYGTASVDTTGNAATATKLQSGNFINGTLFDGTIPITTEIWGTARTVNISDASCANEGTGVEINGSGDYTLPLPSTIAAEIEGNAATATKFHDPVAINGTDFDGSSAITTDTWGTARNITVEDADGTNKAEAVSVNGGADITLKLPETIKGTLTGNSSSATKLQTARTIQTDLASESAPNFDGTVNITPGVKGILPITHGGTGASTKETARDNLGLGNVSVLNTNGNVDNVLRGDGTWGEYKTPNVANNLTTTEEGFVLDARMGKVLADQIDDLTIGLGTEPTNVHQIKGYSITGASGDPAWVRLGTITTADSNSAIIEVYSGDGYNAGVRQNSWFRIFIKDGWQETGSAESAYAATVEFGPANYNSEVKVKLLASSASNCDIWVYLPWGYWNGNYTIKGFYSAWTHSGIYQTDEPTNGTSQAVSYVRIGANIDECTDADITECENLFTA